MGMAEDLQRYGQMPPGLLSPGGIDPNGDEALAMQIARDQGVPMDVARYMLSAPSYSEGQGRNDPALPSQAWPYYYQGRDQDARSQLMMPQRDDALNRQLWQQRLNPTPQNIADQPTPFGPAGNPAGEGYPQQQQQLDFSRRTGRPEWFGGQQWQGPMRMMPGSQGRPANEAMLQQLMRAYGLA